MKHNVATSIAEYTFWVSKLIRLQFSNLAGRTPSPLYTLPPRHHHIHNLPHRHSLFPLRKRRH